MGKAGHGRRRAERRRPRGQRPPQGGGEAAGPTSGSSSGPPPNDAETAAELVGTALDSLRRRDEAGTDSALAGLADTERAAWAEAVDRTLFAALLARVAAVWRRHWQPGETVRHAGRLLERGAADLCADMILAEHRHHPAAGVDARWSAQIRTLGPEPWWEDDGRHLAAFAERHGLSRLAAVDTALRLAAALETFPPMEKLCPLPGEARPGTGAVSGPADPARLGRIRRLLAKAESTDFPEEAEALTARAQEMMARHSIDHALLAADSGSGSAASGRRLPVDAPYEQHKAVLLDVVAGANHCRSVWHEELGLCTVVGLPGDIDTVETLFTSLLVQATGAMHGSATRSYRSSFLAAFADRIGERLARAAEDTERDATAEYARAGRDLVPVFAARQQEVDAAVDDMFPGLSYSRMRGPSDEEGWYAGRAAAETAALRAREEVRRG